MSDTNEGGSEIQTLWTRRALTAAVGGEAVGDWSGVGGLQIDSREVGPGDLFVALSGGARDGHGFVAAALAAGAAAALVHQAPADAETAALLTAPDDTLAALARIAAAGRARLAADAAVIGVTGSNGKTTVKEMLRAMGAAAIGDPNRTQAAARSFNNHIGVPLTLARLPADTRVAAIEIGMNAPGEIAPLSRLAAPHAAIVTMVAPAHLAAFDDLAGIADEKASIVDGVEAGGAAILNADTPYFERIAARAAARNLEIVDFGAAGRRARLLGVEPSAADGAHGLGQIVRTEIDGRLFEVPIGAPGAHLAQNALAALAALASVANRLDGMDLDAAATALAGWAPGAGRGARRRAPSPDGGVFTLVDESYNANPGSMRAALSSFAATAPGAGGRRIAFLTDMLELGPAAETLHAGLAPDLEAAGVDLLHAAGPLMRALYDAVGSARRGLWAPTADALAEAAPGLVRGGDVVIVKGSLGSRARLVAERLTALGATPNPATDAPT